MAGVALIDWDALGPYRVAFSTREGGVSEGAYASLNLGIRTEDDPASVVENRRRLCEAVGADADAATMAWQRHGATVTRAQSRGIVTPGTVYDHCDGLWSDERGRAMLLITADCVPVAIARRPESRVRPALAVLHVGWRGLLAGIVAEGVRAIGPGSSRLSSARRSGRAATRWGRSSPARRARRSAPTSSWTASSISGPASSERSARPAVSTWSGSTSAPRATASTSSPIAEISAAQVARE